MKPYKATLHHQAIQATKANTDAGAILSFDAASLPAHVQAQDTQVSAVPYCLEFRASMLA